MNRYYHSIFFGFLFLFAVVLPVVGAKENQVKDYKLLARAIFKQLVEIDTTDANGNNTKAAQAMAVHLHAAGFADKDVLVIGQERESRKGNLIVRLRGTGKQKPILLLAHLDVVDADKADWEFDPFMFLEKGDYFYGRGTTDDKDMVAIWVANLIRYKQEGYIPDRDIIVALTADEEWGYYNGVRWLLEEHRELIDAEYALNEGGRGQIRDGKYLFNEIQMSEKTYATFHLEVRNDGGHSSRPVKENAIYRLTQGLLRLAAFDFPVQLDTVTKEFFSKMSALESGQVAMDMQALLQPEIAQDAVDRLAVSPYFNAIMRTTCVTTMLEAGHAENALPRKALATVNCRLIPGASVESVHKTLVKVLDDERIEIAVQGKPLVGPPSPLNPQVMSAANKITSAMWEDVPVMPIMMTGGTDGLFLRNAGIPTYGISGIFGDMNDRRAHGKDERILIKSFYEGQEFLYRLVKELSSGNSAK